MDHSSPELLAQPPAAVLFSIAGVVIVNEVLIIRAPERRPVVECIRRLRVLSAQELVPRNLCLEFAFRHSSPRMRFHQTVRYVHIVAESPLFRFPLETTWATPLARLQ